jgi:hypothetical protein
VTPPPGLEAASPIIVVLSVACAAPVALDLTRRLPAA